MSKSPPNIPSVGDICELRGRRGRTGKVMSIDAESKWTVVHWDDRFGPHLCHLYELVAVPCQTSTTDAT